MNVTISVDCTPEEARRFLGLPDVEQANRMYMEQMMAAMKGATSMDQMQDYAKQLAPMGQMGIKMFQSLMESGAAFASGASDTASRTGTRDKS